MEIKLRSEIVREWWKGRGDGTLPDDRNVYISIVVGECQSTVGICQSYTPGHPKRVRVPICQVNLNNLS